MKFHGSYSSQDVVCQPACMPTHKNLLGWYSHLLQSGDLRVFIGMKVHGSYRSQDVVCAVLQPACMLKTSLLPKVVVGNLLECLGLCLRASET